MPVNTRQCDRMHDHSHIRSVHARIRHDIEARIHSGEWVPGFRIPPEHELMVQYGCSRMTVSKAVSALVADGLIIRNRRAGSFVAKPPMHSAVLHIPDIRREIEARGGRYEYRCLAVETREACCSHLGAEGLELGESIFVRSIHLSDGKPLLLEERHIFVRAVPAAKGPDFTMIPPGSWLLENVPWTQAEHRIAAKAAEAAVARALAIPIGSACLILERRTWRGKETLTRVQQIFRGDAYDLTARFGPNAT